MADLTYFKLNALRFYMSARVRAMSAEERGAFFWLLLESWLGGKDAALPTNLELLAQSAKVEHISERVLEMFPEIETETGTVRRNDTIHEEWMRVNSVVGSGSKGGQSTSPAKQAAAQVNGSKGGRPRKTQAENPSEPKPEPNETKAREENITIENSKEDENTHTQHATKTQNQGVCVSPSNQGQGFNPYVEAMKLIPTDMLASIYPPIQQQIKKLIAEHGWEKFVIAVQLYWQELDPTTIVKWPAFLAAAAVWISKVNPDQLNELHNKRALSTPQGQAKREAAMAAARKADGDTWDSMTKPASNVGEVSLADYMQETHILEDDAIPAVPLD